MDRPNGHITRKEFNDRIDRLEDKIDILMRRVAYVYGFGGGIGLIAGILGSQLL